MASGFYLIDNPPARSQGGAPRWEPANGMVGVHVTAGALDAIAPDRGAENVANFIRTRSDPGSYHEIHDSDSVVVMAPDDWMTWHTAAANLNGPTWGISAACHAHEWSVNPWEPNYWWTITVIASMGRSIRAYWERNGYDVVSSARWLTKDQARNRQVQFGRLYHHGVAQPEDRSDAWVLHPDRVTLDEMLVIAIVGSAPVDPDEQWWRDLMGVPAEFEAALDAGLTKHTGIQGADGAGNSLEQFHKDDRAWMVPGKPWRAPGHPAVFVLVANGDGDLVRRHVRSTGHLAFEQGQRVVAALPVLEIAAGDVAVARTYPLTPASIISLADANVPDI